MNKIMRVFTFGLIGLAVGCVVIPDSFDANINVTIRHIEEQADDFWDDVESETTSDSAGENELSFLQRAINFINPIQTAYAAEKLSPRMDQIKAKIKQRYGDVQAAKKTGAVGESNRGMLELVKADKISDGDQKNEVQRVIAVENEDRKALYKEIARLNNDQNMTVTTVEHAHAASLMKRAKKGDLVQVPSDADFLQKFKDTPIGKKLGSAKPGSWVNVP